MKTFRALSCLFIFISSFFVSIAQQYEYKIAPEEKESWLGFARNNKDEYYNVSCKPSWKGKMEILMVTKYDNNLNIIFSKQYPEFKKWRFKNAVATDGKLNLLLTEDDMLVLVQLDEQSGNILSQQKVVRATDDKYGWARIAYSQDSSKIGVLIANLSDNSKKSTFSYLVADRNFNVLHVGIIEPKLNEYGSWPQHLISNDGALLFGCLSTKKKGKHEQVALATVHWWRCTATNKTSGTILEVDRRYGKPVYNVLPNGNLSFFSFVASKERGTYDLLASCEYDFNSQKTIGYKELKLSDVAAVQKSKILENDPYNLLSGNYVNKIIRLSDGSSIVIYEHNSYLSSSIARDIARVDNYSKDILIYKIRENQIEWMAKINKDQTQQTWQSFLYSGSMLDYSGNLHMFFHGKPNSEDLIKISELNKYSLIDAKINSNGEVSQEVVVSNSNYEEFLCPESCFSGKAGEMIFMVSKLKYVNNEKHKTGIIKTKR
jgi:hypothetical protein